MDPVERTQRLARALRRLGLALLLCTALTGGLVGVIGASILLGFVASVVAISSGAVRMWFVGAGVALVASAAASFAASRHDSPTTGAIVIAGGGAAVLCGVLGCRRMATWVGGVRGWSIAGVLAGASALGFAAIAGFVAARPLTTDGSMRYFGVHVPTNALTVIVAAVALATLVVTWRAFADLSARVESAVDRALTEKAAAAHG